MFDSELHNNLAVFKALRSPEALPPQMHDMEALYRMVEAYRPNIVIEFGCGFSTVAILTALKNNKHGFLFSVESEAEWAKDFANTIKVKAFNALSKNLRLMKSSIGGTQVFDHEGWHYFDAPQVTPDIIYLDGPKLTNGSEITLTPAKYLISRPKGHHIRMAIDGREASVRYYRETWKGREYDTTHPRWAVLDFSDHNTP